MRGRVDVKVGRGGRWSLLLLLGLALSCFAIDTAEVKGGAAKPEAKPATEAKATAEIHHLFDYLEKSGCRFERNGKWHTSQEATAHLRKKHAHLKKRGEITSAEDFIVKAATGSSMSGKAYRVQCGDAEPVASAKWLGDELARHRNP